MNQTADIRFGKSPESEARPLPEERERRHQLSLMARRQLAVDGVKHVDSFDDDSIVLSTDMGTLTIRGRNLRIHQLDLEAGRFTAEGEVDVMTYSQRRDLKAQSLLKKLWR